MAYRVNNCLDDKIVGVEDTASACLQKLLVHFVKQVVKSRWLLYAACIVTTSLFSSILCLAVSDVERSYINKLNLSDCLVVKNRSGTNKSQQGRFLQHVAGKICRNRLETVWTSGPSNVSQQWKCEDATRHED